MTWHQITDHLWEYVNNKKQIIATIYIESHGVFLFQIQEDRVNAEGSFIIGNLEKTNLSAVKSLVENIVRDIGLET